MPMLRRGGGSTMIEVRLTINEHYEFIKLYDILRDMDFELTDNQQSVFKKIQSQFKFNKRR